MNEQEPIKIEPFLANALEELEDKIVSYEGRVGKLIRFTSETGPQADAESAERAKDLKEMKERGLLDNVEEMTFYPFFATDIPGGQEVWAVEIK